MPLELVFHDNSGRRPLPYRLAGPAQASALDSGDALIGFSAAWPPPGPAVAAETMARAATNIDMLAARLQALGYRFAQTAPVHRPPSAQTAALLDAFVARHGPMPLSLRAFYEVAGTADLTQSTTQLIQWWPEGRREKASELEIAGEYDPAGH